MHNQQNCVSLQKIYYKVIHNPTMKEPKKYEITEPENSIVSEPAVAYNRQVCTLSVEDFTRLMGVDDDQFEELRSHGFYQDECPTDELPDDIDSYIEALESTGRNRYVSDSAVDSIRTVWKHVG